MSKFNTHQYKIMIEAIEGSIKLYVGDKMYNEHEEILTSSYKNNDCHGLGIMAKTPEEKEKERKRRAEEISKMIHPHDDDQIQLHTWGIIIFHRCYLLSVWGSCVCLSWQSIL